MYLTSAPMRLVSSMMFLRFMFTPPMALTSCRLWAANALHWNRKWVTVSAGASSPAFPWHCWHSLDSDLPILKRKELRGIWPLCQGPQIRLEVPEGPTPTLLVDYSCCSYSSLLPWAIGENLEVCLVLVLFLDWMFSRFQNDHSEVHDLVGVFCSWGDDFHSDLVEPKCC